MTKKCAPEEEDCHQSLRQIFSEENPTHEALVFAMGAITMIVVICLVRRYRRYRIDELGRAERERREAEEKVRLEDQERRDHITNALHANNLSKVLVPGDFEGTPPPPLNAPADIETGNPKKTQEKTTANNPTPTPATTSKLEVEEASSEKNSSNTEASTTEETGSQSLDESSRSSSSSSNKKAMGRKGSECSLDDMDLRACRVIVPRENGPLSIAGVCAICLERYRVGDTVAWSGNSQCPHAFHEKCILDYFVTNHAEAAPCPCCRELFLPVVC